MTAEGIPGPGLDERGVGAGTTVRFALLVVLLLVASGSMMLEVATALAGPVDFGCMLAAGANPEATDLQMQLATLSQEAAYRACTARYLPDPPPWWIAMAWPVLLPAAAAALFRVLPAWKGRRGRVVPLDTLDRDGHLRRQLDALVATAGLARAPRFVVDPTITSIGAVVFGRNRQPTVCLYGGLLASGRAEGRTASERFRAVVLHELAHIRNGDLTVTYTTVAVWRVFLVGVLLPFTVAAIVDIVRWPNPHADDVSSPVVLTRALLLPAVMVALVYLSRSDVLRSREIYADRAAVRWGADPSYWVHRAASSGESRARRAYPSFLEALRQAFLGLWRSHPHWDLRRHALTDPSALFELPALPMFLTGAAAILINAQLSSALARYGLLGGWWGASAGALSAGLLTAVAGFALWRATVYAALTARPAPSGLRTGLWLGAGMAAGELVRNRATVYDWLPARPQVFALAVLTGVVFLCWVAQCAQLWIRTWWGRTIHPPMIVTLVAAGLVLISWFAWWNNEIPNLSMGSPFSQEGQLQILERAYDIPPGQHPEALSVIAAVFPIVLAASGAPLASLAVAALWLVPLVAFLVRPTTDAPPWARATLSDTYQSPLPAPPPWSRVLLAGLLGGTLCCATVVIVRALLHARPPAPPSPGLYVVSYMAWLFVALTLGAAIAAGAVSVLAGHYRLLVSLIAAEIATLVGLAGIFLLSSLENCLPPASAHRATCHWLPAPAWRFTEVFLAPGFLVSALVAIVVAAIAAGCVAATMTASRSTRRPSPLPPELETPGRQRHRLDARRLSVAALCVAALGVTLVTTTDDLAQGRHQPAQATLAEQGSLRVVDEPVSPRIRALQVSAWAETGGLELLRRLRDDLRTVAYVGSEAPHDVFEAPDDVSVDQALARVRLACADLSQLSRDAESFFRIPDPETQRIWRALLERAERAGTDCVHGLDQRNSTLFGTAMIGLGEVSAAARDLDQRLRAVLAAGRSAEGN